MLVQMSAGNLALGVLEVTDDRFPGVVFTGTAQSVYEEMKALKPEAFPDTDGTDVVRERAVGVVSHQSLSIPLGLLIMHAYFIVNSSIVNGA
jgi:hypothetical protein